jgi:RHS repeat-associated protein
MRYFPLHYLLAALLFPLCLLAQTETPAPSSSVAGLEGLASNLINNAVCCITGEYVEQAVDIFIPGPEPLVIGRSYSSQDMGGNLCTSWSINHYDSAVGSTITQFYKSHFRLLLTQPSTARLAYLYTIKDDKFKKERKIEFKLNLPKGMTNGSASEISGRSNLKNQKVYYYPQDEEIKVIDGAGNKRFLKKGSANKEASYYSWQQMQEDKISGNCLLYKHDEDTHLLSRICATNKKHDVLYGEVEIKRRGSKEHPIVSYETNMGKEVLYHFDRHKYKVKTKEKYSTQEDYFVENYLKKVERTDRPNQFYKYTEKSNDKQLHVSHKILPDNRFLKVSYYKKGINGLGKLDPITLKKDDYRLDRVKTLSAPAGADDTPIVTHYFTYHANQNSEEEILNGRTEVFDADLHKTAYHYNKEHRLTSIDYFSGTYPHFNLHHSEKHIWDAKDSSQEGNLLGKYIEDAKGNIHCARHLTYDKFGNVKKDSLLGCLTGHETAPLKLNKDQTFSGAESYSKQYTHSDDGLNLLLSEKEPNNKMTQYGYYPGTNLLKHKFICFGKKILIREFYHYNKNSVIIKSIIDDGSSTDENNLSDVKERKITYCTLRQKAPYHLPEQIDEFYFDKETKQEILIKRICCEYSPEGHLLSQDHYDSQKKLCYSLQWDYDAHGNVIKEVNALDETIEREYDANDNLIVQRGPGKLNVTYTYDFCNRLIKEMTETDGQTFVISHCYNLLGQKIATIDPFGNETNFYYNDLGQLTGTKLPAVVDEHEALLTPSLHTQYSLLGHTSCQIDAKGKKTTTAHNIRGQPIHTSYPDGTQEWWTYELNGDLACKIEKNSKITKYMRDYLGRVIQEDILAPNKEVLKSTHFKYDAFHLLSSTDSEGLVTSYTYDKAGRVIKTTKGDQEIEQTYDTLGRIDTIKEWISLKTWRLHKKEYDLLNRVVKEQVINSKGNVESLAIYAYDNCGNQTLVQKGDVATRTEYNSYKKPIKITDAMDNETHITYNTCYLNAHRQQVLQSTTTDPLGNQTIHTCDSLGRIVETQRKNAFGKTVACVQSIYDANGNQTKTIQIVYDGQEISRKIYIQWEYDDANHKIKTTEAVGTPEQKITRYHYNNYGQMDCLIKPDGTEICSDFDIEGRLHKYFASDKSFDYVYEYNKADLPVRIKDRIHKLVTTRTYDIMGQLLDETLGTGIKLSYAYDRVGRMATITLPDESNIEYIYGASHLKKIRRLKQGAVIYRYQEKGHNLSGLPAQEISIRNSIKQLSYDQLGRLINIEDALVTQEVPSNGYDAAGNLLKYRHNKKTYKFDYDDLYQLKSEKGVKEHTYRYDSISSRLKKDNQCCVVNDLNQPLSQGREKYAYDSNGNLKTQKLEKGIPVHFQCDALGRLTQVESEGVVVTYIYDSFNRRIAKKQNGMPDQCFMYQGMQELGSIENGKIKELKVIKPGTRGHAIALELNEIIYEPIHDLFGNVIGLSNLNGNLIEQYHYTAFGEEQIVDSQGNTFTQAITPWRYADRRVDAETRFIAFGLRYYNPSTGTWVTPDPLGDADGPNLYAYVHASPLVYYDSLGLSADPYIMLGLVGHVLGHSRPDAPVLFSPNHDLPKGAYGILDLTASWAGGWDTGHFDQQTANHNLQKDHKLFDLDQPLDLKIDRNHRMIFNNGIMNTFSDYKLSILHLKKILPGCNLYGTFCPTRDIFRDALRYTFTTFFNVAFDAVSNLHEQWNDFFDNADPTATLLQICHSWGAANVRNALKTYPEALRKRITVLAIAPGCYIDRRLCKDVFHYVCTSDPVPAIFGIGQGMALEQGTIHYIQDPTNSRFSLAAHSFNNPMYTRIIKYHADKYLGPY